MRTLVLVSGAPGAGKSTLAPPLATHLGLPLLSKDVIKEALFDTLGSVDDDPLTSSRRLGAAAMTLLWHLAGHCPAVMLEANFRSASEYERDRVAELCPRPGRCWEVELVETRPATEDQLVGQVRIVGDLHDEAGQREVLFDLVLGWPGSSR